MAVCPFAAQYPVRNHSGALKRNLGLVLHVQQGNGSLRHFFDVTANQASSTFWVSRTGVIEQYVDSDVRAWAQAAGNDSYCSVETEGWDTDALTDAQVNAVAKLYRWGHQVHGWPYAVVDRPGEAGLIYHGAGGRAWGGHTGCAGSLRDAQRPAIIAAAQGGIPDEKEWNVMASKEEIAVVVREELATYDKTAAKRHQQVLAYCTWLQSRIADSIVVSAFWRVLGRGPDAKGRAVNVDAVVASKVTPAALDANLGRSSEAGELKLSNRRTADARKP